MKVDIDSCRIAVVGLGYVGLPLALALSKKFECVGFDINDERVKALQSGIDLTNEVSQQELASVNIAFTTDQAALKDCNVFIVTVPTPIDQHKRPNLTPLQSASRMISQHLSEGDIVIYESTVFPGATEEVCIPILETGSGLKLNEDFFAGYSPERINPGDKKHRVDTIVKVTSGSSPEAAEFVDRLYGTIVTAGTHKASSIKVAEAAKVIENSQRDLNIAFVNELCIIFEKLGLDTEEILLAAGTKWNFLPFRPGLVGGHCISVDPYYLTHKAQEIGYQPEVILAGRRINDGMGEFIAGRVIKLLTQERIHIVDSRVLLMGLSFKENCPDLRNTRVVDVIHGLREYNVDVDVYDPWVSQAEAWNEYAIALIDHPEATAYDAIIIAVAHDCFRELEFDLLRSYGKQECIIFDVKYMLPKMEGVHRL